MDRGQTPASQEGLVNGSHLRGASSRPTGQLIPRTPPGRTLDERMGHYGVEVPVPPVRIGRQSDGRDRTASETTAQRG